MVRIVTVHGTFASRPSDSGDSWWQKGSPFLTAVQALIADKLEIQPFHWSGANSEMERRRTGGRLAETLHDCSDPPILVGHSHGGSAAIQALLILYIKKGEDCCKIVRGFTTVGTPMFRFRSNHNPFSRFDVAGRLMLLFALGLMAMQAGGIASRENAGYEVQNFLTGLAEFVMSIQFGLAAIIVFSLWAYSRRNQKREQFFRKNTLFGAFKDRYVALNHHQDEAINGLQKANVLKPKLLKYKTIFVSIFSGLSFVLLSFFFGVQLLEVGKVPLPRVVGESFTTLENLVLDPAEDVLYAIGGDLSDSAFFGELVEVFSLVPVAGFIAFSAIIAFLVALIVTPGLSAFLTAQVKGQSFGDDGFGETIAHVAPGLDFEQADVGTLPADVEQEMIDASTKDAGTAITRLRELLSSGELLDSKGADLVAQSMKFERSELLHNAYFHSPLFVRYFAAQLVGRFGLTPSAAFEADADARRFLDMIVSGQEPSAPLTKPSV